MLEPRREPLRRGAVHGAAGEAVGRDADERDADTQPDPGEDTDQHLGAEPDEQADQRKEHHEPGRHRAGDEQACPQALARPQASASRRIADQQAEICGQHGEAAGIDRRGHAGREGEAEREQPT